MSIFDNVFVQNADKTSSKLPIFLKACCYYYKQTGSLPQPTVLPDISTTTANYIDLKDVYKE